MRLRSAATSQRHRKIGVLWSQSLFARWLVKNRFWQTKGPVRTSVGSGSGGPGQHQRFDSFSIALSSRRFATHCPGMASTIEHLLAHAGSRGHNAPTD